MLFLLDIYLKACPHSFLISILGVSVRFQIQCSKQGSEREKKDLGHPGLLGGGHLSALFGPGLWGLVGRNIFLRLSCQVESLGSDPQEPNPFFLYPGLVLPNTAPPQGPPASPTPAPMDVSNHPVPGSPGLCTLLLQLLLLQGRHTLLILCFISGHLMFPDFSSNPWSTFFLSSLLRVQGDRAPWQSGWAISVSSACLWAIHHTARPARSPHSPAPLLQLFFQTGTPSAPVCPETLSSIPAAALSFFLMREVELPNGVESLFKCKPQSVHLFFSSCP